MHQMSFILLASATLLATASATSDGEWSVFKQRYSKSYASAEEEVLRRYNWQQNLKLIELHNEKFAAGLTTFYMKENKYCDMSRDEFGAVMQGHSVKVSPSDLNGSKSVGSSAFDLPKTVDWRPKGYVTKVKDQGPCGSCWAFSTTGGLEGQHFKATGKLVSLSESNLIDCTRPWGNYGCHGGLMDNSYEYIIDNGGIDTEKSYPYDPSDGSCYFTEQGIGATMSAYKGVTRGNETALQEAIAKIGPVSVAINADLDSFRTYGGGVFNHPECSQDKLDHAVLVVGYGTDDKTGLDYWIVKNSWGDSWGQKGYIWMARNQNNQCGIASLAFYPIV